MKKLPGELETEIYRVKKLVSQVKEGRFRLPSFQRRFKWKRSDVIDLFDSIYRGYPVGSLLMWRRPARAQKIKMGRLVTDAPEFEDALWIVDGQQRITSLVSCLVPGLALADAPFDADIYFDISKEKFHARRGATPESEWVPLNLMLDEIEIGNWVFNWTHRDNEAWRRRVFDVSGRIREYPLPVYIVKTREDSILREIFRRVNRQGKRLEEHEVFQSLLGIDEPQDLSKLSESLSPMGFGHIPQKTIYHCVSAVAGFDPYKRLSKLQELDESALPTAIRQTAPALRRTVDFLRRRCAIPHLSMLPYRMPLIILAAFFARHPTPHDRSLQLLSRWVWRGALTEVHATLEGTVLSTSLRAIRGEQGEEEIVQQLLATIDRPPKKWSPELKYSANFARTKLGLLALASLEPRDLGSGKIIEVSSHIGNHGTNAFTRIVPSSSGHNQQLLKSIANRIIHAGEIIEFMIVNCRNAERLASHAISKSAQDALLEGDTATFLSLRAETIANAVERFCSKMAAWEQNDRPSINHLFDLRN